MPNRTTEELNFVRLGRRHLQANFQGGDLSFCSLANATSLPDRTTVWTFENRIGQAGA